MRKFLKKYSIAIGLLVGILLTIGTAAYADANVSFWVNQTGNNLYTNTGNGLGNATIHVAGCVGCGSGGGVTSLNTLTGALNLVAGTGISINSTSSSQITISNTAIGGAVSIGNPVLSSNPTSVLYTDASGNLANDANFTYDPISENYNETIGNSNFNQSGSNGETSISSYGEAQLFVSDNTGIQEFGDLEGDWNDDYLIIDGPSHTINLDDEGSPYLSINNATRLYQFGDIADAGNGSYLNVNDSTAETTLGYGNGSIPLTVNSLANAQLGDWNVDSSSGMGVDVNQQSSTVKIGNDDSGGSHNGTSLTIDDLAELFTLTNVPQYANDAAAEGAGLTTGQLYETTTLGTTALNIVP